MTSPCHYAVMAVPRKERMAVLALLAQQIDVFWPHFVAGVRIGRRRGYALRSWIPPYLFVSDRSPTFEFHTVATTQNVTGFVQMGEAPLVVPSDLIWEIKEIADPTGCIPAYPQARRPLNMVQVRGENIIKALEELHGFKRTSWARGMTA